VAIPKDPPPVLEDVIKDVSQAGVVTMKHAIQMSRLLGRLGTAQDRERITAGLEALQSWQLLGVDQRTTRTIINALARGYEEALEALNGPPESLSELQQLTLTALKDNCLEGDALHVTVVASFVAKAANRSFTDEEIRDALDQLCNLGLAELKVPDNYAPIRAHEFDQEVLDEVLQTVSAVGPANTQSLIDHQASIAFRISEQQMHTALGRLEKDGLIMQTEAGPELTEKGNQETARLWGQRES
jgi:hypothetical protein